MVKLRFVAPEKLPKSEGPARNRLKKKKKTKAFPLHRLPNEVLCVILSQLPFKEAARTSIVCRNWRRLWRCYPKLILTRETMLGGSAAGDHPTFDAATFIRRVNSIVRQLSSSATLNKFVVKFPLLSTDASHIDRWASLSAASRARRIVLDLCPEVTSTERNVRYSFPLHLFSGSSCVKSLCLGFVSMNLPPGPCGFTNLKKLGLHMVPITGDLQCLLPECDVLEWLSLTECSLHPYLILHRPLQQLRYLRVLNCRLHRLELQAPNLTEFEFTNYPVPLILGDCPDMSMASIGLLSPEYGFGYACNELPAALPHVQDSLSISLNIRTEAREFVKGSISVFANLRHLALTVAIQGCPKTGTGILNLACLLELAPVLEELEIHIDKASMLEEAIEYLKTLQLQVQMMSMGTGLCMPPMLLPAMQMPHPMAAHFPHLGMGLGFGMSAAAAAFDMARHFPCPPMAMPPGPMFGVPGQAMPPGPMFGVPGQAMPPPPAAAAFALMATTAPPEQMEAAPARRGAEAEADQPPAAPFVTQGDEKLQRPTKQT